MNSNGAHSKVLGTNQLLVLNVLGNANGYLSRGSILAVLLRFDTLDLSPGSVSQAIQAMAGRGLIDRREVEGETAVYGLTEEGAEQLRAFKSVFGRVDVPERFIVQ